MSLDALIVEFDKGLRTLFARARTVRPVPGSDLPDAVLDAVEQKHALGLMRINHCGEICAQALYQGQALTCRTQEIRQSLRSAAQEETEHLAWTEQRIAELGGRTSVFKPFWYLGSLTIGMAAGALGDRWNLGFLAETERQVEAHLDGHLERLPAEDLRSRAILVQMRDDEIRHAETAVDLGAAELPAPVKQVMKLSARFMTSTVYYL